MDFNDKEEYQELNIMTPPLIVPEYKGEPLRGMYLVFSGDKKLTNKVKELGAIVDVGIRKRTTLLVIDKPGCSKEKEASCKGIEIISLKEFKLKYL
jgi:BRCT domain type II-containing protein